MKKTILFSIMTYATLFDIVIIDYIYLKQSHMLNSVTQYDGIWNFGNWLGQSIQNGITDFIKQL
jgi:hypothetical protein